MIRLAAHEARAAKRPVSKGRERENVGQLGESLKHTTRCHVRDQHQTRRGTSSAKRVQQAGTKGGRDRRSNVVQSPEQPVGLLLFVALGARAGSIVPDVNQNAAVVLLLVLLVMA